MFAGHVGIALALAAADRRLNAGALVAASLLPDLLLWAFVLLGWESVRIPPDFALHRQPVFDFPWSHGLAASLAWSAAVAASGYAATRRPRAAALLALAFASHWLLDVAVHRPELPLLGPGSPHVGLRGWDHLALAFALEAILVAAGIALLLRGHTLPRARAWGLALLALALLAFTVAGMTLAPPPPSPSAMAAASLASLLLTCALAGWLGRSARATPGRPGIVPGRDLADDPAAPPGAP